MALSVEAQKVLDALKEYPGSVLRLVNTADKGYVLQVAHGTGKGDIAWSGLYIQQEIEVAHYQYLDELLAANVIQRGLDVESEKVYVLPIDKGETTANG